MSPNLKYLLNLKYFDNVSLAYNTCSSFAIDDALSKWPHFHSAYVMGNFDTAVLRLEIFSYRDT